MLALANKKVQPTPLVRAILEMQPIPDVRAIVAVNPIRDDASYSTSETRDSCTSHRTCVAHRALASQKINETLSSSASHNLSVIQCTSAGQVVREAHFLYAKQVLTNLLTFSGSGGTPFPFLTYYPCSPLPEGAGGR